MKSNCCPTVRWRSTSCSQNFSRLRQQIEFDSKCGLPKLKWKSDLPPSPGCLASLIDPPLRLPLRLLAPLSPSFPGSSLSPRRPGAEMCLVTQEPAAKSLTAGGGPHLFPAHPRPLCGMKLPQLWWCLGFTAALPRRPPNEPQQRLEMPLHHLPTSLSMTGQAGPAP